MQIAMLTDLAGDAHSLQGGLDALRAGLAQYAGRLAVVSSFGAESVLLLAFVAEIDPATPVLFLDTGKHFPETLAYRDQVTAQLGLRTVQTIRPAWLDQVARDPDGQLHAFDPDACCALRKVEPLESALAPFDAWVTGRKRAQSASRAAMPVVEQVDGRVKINPLAQWTPRDIDAEFRRRALPRHPLTQRGFASIGCAPCTNATVPGADPRSGRWAAMGKTECGIHQRRG